MAKAIDLSGRTFGRLTVVRQDGFTRNGRTGRLRAWLCTCACGGSKRVSTSDLRKGSVRSCGCLLDETRRAPGAASGHARGRSASPEYGSYHAMRRRCLNPAGKDFARYGGRGISICLRWLHGEGESSGFQCFLSDMGRRPRGATLDRINIDADYSPENCRWATIREQVGNRSISLRDEGQPLSEISRETGIKYHTLRDRFARGDRGPRLRRPVDGTVVRRE